MERDCRKALTLLGLDRAELSILIAGAAKVRSLNLTYRGVDRTTDVLSFPLFENQRAFPKSGEFLIGDVVLDAGRVAVQAKKYGLTLHQETQRLLVHGIVHLLGYDHERNGYQARKMFEIENNILKELPGSYIAPKG